MSVNLENFYKLVDWSQESKTLENIKERQRLRPIKNVEFNIIMNRLIIEDLLNGADIRKLDDTNNYLLEQIIEIENKTDNSIDLINNLIEKSKENIINKTFCLNLC